jgi:hypothetical protein
MKKIQEYKYMNIRETLKIKIIHLFFNLSRKTNKSSLEHIYNLLNNIILSLKTGLYECDDITEIQMYISFFILLYKLIAYTRDINEGKGERTLTYMMIYIWYTHFPVLAINILETIIEIYGSWKDLKYLCSYVREINPSSKLIEKCIDMWNIQLDKDIESTEKSLVCKWIPREKSAFGWLFDKSALLWYYKDPLNPYLSINQIKKKYRQIISKINRELDTPQIKECQNQWSKIYTNDVSVTTKSKQYHTFLNSKNNQNKERIECKSHFEQYFSQATNKDKYTKQMKSFHLGEYLKNPHKQNHIYWNQIKHEILQTRIKRKCILPMINISLENSEEYLKALGIGCMISEISLIKDRIFVYDEISNWIHFSSNNLNDKKRQIMEKSISKGKSNLMNAFRFLIDTMDKNNISFEDVSIVIISDFLKEERNIQQKIKQLFIEKFIQKFIPTIIYWNIGSTISEIKIENSMDIMVSGDSSSLLKFLYKNIDANYTSYSFILDIINNPRYSIIEDYFHELIDPKNVITTNIIEN